MPAHVDAAGSPPRHAWPDHSSPEALADDERIGLDERVALLRRWQYDAAELDVAEEEGMTGGEASLLDRVVAALHRLTGGFDCEAGPPTKHGT